jgi:predicted alpha/beta-fold hydrolase
VNTFVPARGLASGHAQTVAAYVLRRRRAPGVTRVRWDTADGDFVDVDLLAAPPHAPHLLVLHGLEGSSRAGYVSAMLRGAAARGWGAAALNFRSCGGEMNRLPRSYHSGETGDPRFVLQRLREHVTGPLLAVGFSLGGNVLLRMLAEDGAASRVSAAAAVSVPFDLQGCARALDGSGGLTSVYRLRFLRTLKAKALAKARRHPGILELSRLAGVRGIEAFDDAVTAPLHGFGTAARYYAACSSAPVLDRIRVPTLLLSAQDDPLVPFASLPAHAAHNPRLTLVTPEHGGHVGFVGGSVLRPRFWGDERVLQFLEASV